MLQKSVWEDEAVLTPEFLLRCATISLEVSQTTMSILKKIMWEDEMVLTSECHLTWNVTDDHVKHCCQQVGPRKEDTCNLIEIVVCWLSNPALWLEFTKNQCWKFYRRLSTALLTLPSFAFIKRVQVRQKTNFVPVLLVLLEEAGIQPKSQFYNSYIKFWSCYRIKTWCWLVV